MTYPDEIIIFLDNSNLFHSFQTLQFHCDYEKLKAVLTGGRKLVEAILYTGIMYPVKPKDKKWLSKLNHLGYTVKTRSVKVAPDGRKVEKRIDVLMAVDIISAAYEKKCDTIVLVSGDSDFVPVVKKLMELNIRAEIWAFKHLFSEQLKDVARDKNVFYLDDILEKIEFS